MFLYGIVFLYGALRNSFYYMGFIDICLLTVLFIGAFKGWCSGFFREIISMSGFVIGLLFAGSLYAVVGDYLELHFCNSASHTHRGAFNIVESQGDLLPESQYHTIDLAVIPGVAFDAAGNRQLLGIVHRNKFALVPQ